MYSYFCSTMFLMGPMKQLSKMFDKGRIVASCIYIASLALTLFSALKVVRLSFSSAISTLGSLALAHVSSVQMQSAVAHVTLSIVGFGSEYIEIRLAERHFGIVATTAED